jgi:hypothetical protein
VGADHGLTSDHQLGGRLVAVAEIAPELLIRRLTQSRHNYGLGHLMEQIEKVERLGASLGMIELLQWAIDSNVNLGPQLPEAITQLVAYEGNIQITMNALFQSMMELHHHIVTSQYAVN